RYTTSGSGGTLVEDVRPVVVRGTATTGTPADPSIGSRDLPLWRLPIDGVSLGDPERVTQPMPTVKELWDSISHTTAVPCAPASGVPANAISVIRYGRVVRVKVVGSLGVRGGMWDAINLASGLPKPDSSEVYAAGIAQGVASPLLLRVDWNGNLGIRGAGVTGWNGGWLFASFTYLSV
ncbi:hypothetical protein, partial [Collinsella vaginalis]|uniref:hypothetical protein n=1 Tax=Collinsella vaginalis TaxID=1870987 RepID=UPI0015C51106